MCVCSHLWFVRAFMHTLLSEDVIMYITRVILCSNKGILMSLTRQCSFHSSVCHSLSRFRTLSPIKQPTVPPHFFFF
uniref:Secreted peptide n=1 Tax=Rhipicephalus pulchellus TaxID=72859 RepID=L7LUZ3_RHIPC